MDMDLTLFLMDYRRLNFTGIPVFYQGLFKVWGLFLNRWMEPAISLHWLLEEPLIFGARFDVSGPDFPGLTDLLWSKRIFKLKYIINESGYDLKRPEQIVTLLGVRSVRFAKKYLDKLNMVLTDEEKTLLEEFGAGTLVPDNKDLFPDIEILPIIDGDVFNCSLLCTKMNEYIDFCTVEGKTLYKCIVKVINQHNLSLKTDTVWRKKVRN